MDRPCSFSASADGVILNMDSSVSPTAGEQELSVWNGHYECTCYHRLFESRKLPRAPAISGSLRVRFGKSRFKCSNVRAQSRGTAARILPSLFADERGRIVETAPAEFGHFGVGADRARLSGGRIGSQDLVRTHPCFDPPLEHPRTQERSAPLHVHHGALDHGGRPAADL
jgi:hypothetical protein